MASMSFFYGREAVHASPGRRRIVFTAGGAASMAKAQTIPRGQGDGASRSKTADGGDVIIQHCLAQIDILCYSE
jgi:hypothetical protein